MLVEATDETEPRELGEAALRELYPRHWQKRPLEIRTVNPATKDDIEFWEVTPRYTDLRPRIGKPQAGRTTLLVVRRLILFSGSQ